MSGTAADDGRRGYSRRKGGREGQGDRIRRVCAALPSAFEKMSHGTPCFFVEGVLSPHC